MYVPPIYVYLSILFFVVDSNYSDVLPDVCENRLQLFANETAKFTLCVITHARPITVCENCANEYHRVLERYEAIQKVTVL